MSEEYYDIIVEIRKLNAEKNILMDEFKTLMSQDNCKKFIHNYNNEVKTFLYSPDVRVTPTLNRKKVCDLVSYLDNKSSEIIIMNEFDKYIKKKRDNVNYGLVLVKNRGKQVIKPEKDDLNHEKESVKIDGNAKKSVKPGKAKKTVKPGKKSEIVENLFGISKGGKNVYMF